MSFVGNLVDFPAVKEFVKCVKNLQSFHCEFGLPLYCGTLCS